MARKEPHWVNLFLRELKRTGNVRLAAERAGVDFSTAYQRRKRHGEFAERWEGALAAHAERTADAEWEAGTALTLPPPSAAPSLSPNGERGLVARPDGKAIKASDARWSKRAEEGFLLELTVSGNVRLAAKAAGFSTTAVYQRRLKDRHFRAAWDAALETGSARVQAYLVEAATRTFDPDELPIGDEREMPKVSIGEAINIAKLGASAGRRGAAQVEWDADPGEDGLREVQERIADKMKRLIERDERDMAEAGWTEHDIPAPPHFRDAERSKVWLPPGYRLVKDGAAGEGSLTD